MGIRLLGEMTISGEIFVFFDFLFHWRFGFLHWNIPFSIHEANYLKSFLQIMPNVFEIFILIRTDIGFPSG